MKNNNGSILFVSIPRKISTVVFSFNKLCFTCCTYTLTQHTFVLTQLLINSFFLLDVHIFFCFFIKRETNSIFDLIK